MIRIIKYQIYTGLFFVSLLSYSQETPAINKGKMYISEGSKVMFPSEFENSVDANLSNKGETYFRGDLTNDGKFNNNKKGYVIFDGNSKQKINGNDTIMVHDVLFDNSTSNIAFELENKLSVSGTANFADGIVDVNSDPDKSAFIFEQGSKAISVKDKSHVDGLVKKIGKEEFEFPIGDRGYYRYAKISAPKEIADEFSSEYFYKNSNDLMSHNKKTEDIEIINSQEYWSVERNKGESSIMLTLSWEDLPFSAEFFNGDLREILCIVRWDGSNWIDEAGVTDFGNNSITAAVTIPKGDKAYFTFAKRVPKSLDLDIYNAVIIKNTDDHFVIGQLENYDTNRVEIYNRWGVKVYETDNYGEKGNVFNGYSKGRVTLKQGEKLPAGTYYYIITCEYKDSDNQVKNFKKAGYLHLEND